MAQRTLMEEALLRAMVRAGLDKKQQGIRPEVVIPQTTKARTTFVPERKHARLLKMR